MAWTYIDASGVVQGPFNERKLVEWMQNGHFFPGTLAKRSHDKVYRSLVNQGFDVKQLDKETCSAMEAWRYEDWYYMDSMNTKQGPFKISKLVAWKDRYFDEHTMVSCGINGSFVALKQTVIGQVLDESLALSSVPTDISTVPIRNSRTAGANGQASVAGPCGGSNTYKAAGAPDVPVGSKVSLSLQYAAGHESANNVFTATVNFL